MNTTNLQRRMAIIDLSDQFVEAPVIQALDTLETIYANAGSATDAQTETKVQIVIQEKILPLLLDRNKEPYLKGAFTIQSGENLSMESILASTYCTTVHERTGPFEVAVTQEHQGYPKLIEFCKQHGMNLLLSMHGHDLLRILNISPDVTKVPIKLLNPKVLAKELPQSLHELLQLTDPEAEALKEWAQSFVQRLNLLRDDTGALLTDLDEWTVLDSQATLLESLSMPKSGPLFAAVSRWKQQFYPLLQPMRIYQRCCKECPSPPPLFDQTIVQRAARHLVQWEQKGLQALSSQKSLKKELTASLENLRRSADSAYIAHEDDLSYMIADWARAFSRNFEESPDLYKTLQEEIAQLQEICIDPDTRFPLDEKALLSNDEEKRTYNLDSLEVRKEFYPELSGRKHPLLPKILQWMRHYQTRIADWEKAGFARKNKEANLRQAATARAFEEAVRQGLGEIPTASEAMTGLQSASAGFLGSSSDNTLAQRVEILAHKMLQEDPAMLALQEQFKELGKKVAEMQKLLRAQTSSQEELQENLENAKKLALQIAEEAKRMEAEIAATNQESQGRMDGLAKETPQLMQRLSWTEARTGSLEQDRKELDRKVASRNSGFLQGIIAIAGFVAGSVVAFATGNVQAGCAVGAAITTAGTTAVQ